MKCKACKLEAERVAKGVHLGRRPRLTDHEISAALGTRPLVLEGRRRAWSAGRLNHARPAAKAGACTRHLARAFRVSLAASEAVFGKAPKTPFETYKPAQHSARSRRLAALYATTCPVCGAGPDARCTSAGRPTQWHRARIRAAKVNL